MALLAGVVQILACPVCRGGVGESEKELVCPACNLKFPVRDGIPVLLQEAAKPA